MIRTNFYKALIVDFDGTLVNASLTPSSCVSACIQKLLEHHYTVSIATGRPYHGVVKTVCSDLGLLSPQIVRGGAEIVDPKTNSLIWFENIDDNDAMEVRDFSSKKNLSFNVEKDQYVYTQGGTIIPEYGPGTVFKDVKDLQYERVAKIVVMIKHQRADPNILESEMQHRFKTLHIIKSKSPFGNYVLDITSEKASKHVAVLKLSQMIGIEKERIIGVGDGYNDYPLLSACGLKVAMRTAPKELTDIADIVVSAVDQDGLVELFDKLRESL